MQQGRALDTNELRGKEVDEESESSISTTSSSVGILPDSPGDDGHHRDDEPFTYKTVEHFPGAIELDLRRDYVRHVGGTEARNSRGAGAAVQGVGEGTHSHYGGYVGQQGAMYVQYGDYSYDPNWVPPSPTLILSIEHMLIEQGRLPPRLPQRSIHAPHCYFMPLDFNLQGINIVHCLIKSNLNMVMGMIVLRTV
ncbi:hypothetical protein AAC387_Pa01g2771 [Persea americana]